jgi:hypothetical protein
MQEATFRIKISVEPETEPTAKAAEVEIDEVAGIVVKSQAEQQFTLCLAYPANRPDAGVAQDGFRDFASPQAVEKAAWQYITQSPNVGLHHREGTDGAGRVVESYIWRADPWVIKAADGSEQTVNPGDWLLGVRWGDDAWSAIKSGQIGGLSPQGRARRRTPTPEAVANLRS